MKYCNSSMFEMHDPVCVMTALDILMKNKSSYTTKFVDLKIETDGKYTRGMSIIDKRPYSGENNDWQDFIEEEEGDLWNKKSRNNVELIVEYRDSKTFSKNLFQCLFNIK